jgi:hypothetical protein
VVVICDRILFTENLQNSVTVSETNVSRKCTILVDLDEKCG